MNDKKTNLRALIPNLEWLEVSRLRPSWGPWPVKVLVTASFLEQLLTPMEGLSEPERCLAVSKFFVALSRVLSAKPELGRVNMERDDSLLVMMAGQVELVMVELEAADERTDLLIGVCIETEGVWQLAGAGDWLEVRE